MAIACLAGIPARQAAFAFWAALPRWTPFVSKPIHSYRLGIEVPVGWECLEEGDTPDDVVIRMHRKPIVGVAQWWQKYVLRKGVTSAPEEQYQVELLFSQVAPSNNDADYFHFLASGVLESSMATLRTYEHPLGPALVRTDGQGNKGLDSNTRILLLRHPQQQRLEVIADRSGANAASSRAQSEWEQVVRSIRIVQK